MPPRRRSSVHPLAHSPTPCLLSVSAEPGSACALRLPGRMRRGAPVGRGEVACVVSGTRQTSVDICGWVKERRGVSVWLLAPEYRTTLNLSSCSLCPGHQAPCLHWAASCSPLSPRGGVPAGGPWLVLRVLRSPAVCSGKEQRPSFSVGLFLTRVLLGTGAGERRPSLVASG